MKQIIIYFLILPICQDITIPIPTSDSLLRTLSREGLDCYFAKISRVVDGDTILFGGLGKVRLLGIDCQETTHHRYNRTKNPKYLPTPLGNIQKEVVRELVEIYQDKLWCLELKGKDKYRRRLANIYTPDYKSLQELLIKFYGAELYI